MSIEFRAYRAADYEALEQRIFQLYAEDIGGHMTREKIRGTVSQLTADPGRGRIVIFEADGQVVGYALLINFWSNEYGGNIVFLDELYIDEAYRGQGIGAAFMEQLVQRRFGEANAFVLEVMPDNVRALEFYQRLGFVEDGRKHLVWVG